MGKLQAEREKLKNMSFREKIEYILMYYKIWFAGFIAVLVLIYLGFTMYQGRQVNVLLNVAVVGGNPQNTEEFSQLEEQIKGIMKSKDSHDKVRIQANIPEDGGASYSQTALTTLIGAEAVDVVICPKEIYESYHAQGGFAALPKYLTGPSEKLQAQMEQEDALVLKNSEVMKAIFGVQYEEVYVCVLVNAKHLDGVRPFFEAISKDAVSEELGEW